VLDQLVPADHAARAFDKEHEHVEHQWLDVLDRAFAPELEAIDVEFEKVEPKQHR
jgi:hypothetical protein